MLIEQFCADLKTAEDVSEIVTEGIEEIKNVYKISLKKKEHPSMPDLHAFVNDKTLAFIDGTNNDLVVSELEKNREAENDHREPLRERKKVFSLCAQDGGLILVGYRDDEVEIFKFEKGSGIEKILSTVE